MTDEMYRIVVDKHDGQVLRDSASGGLSLRAKPERSASLLILASGRAACDCALGVKSIHSRQNEILKSRNLVARIDIFIVVPGRVCRHPNESSLPGVIVIF